MDMVEAGFRGGCVTCGIEDGACHRLTGGSRDIILIMFAGGGFDLV